MRHRTRIIAWLLAGLAGFLPAVAPAVPTTAGAQDENPAVAEFRAAVAEMRARMMRPGEAVEGWDVGGVDPDAEVRRRGADRYYELTHGDQADSLTILTDRRIGDLAPARWRAVDSYGEDVETLEGGQVDFVPFSARYVFAARVRAERRGDVSCYGDIQHARLYEIPGAPDGADDAAIPVLFRMLILALADQTICIRSDGGPDQGYRARVFLPDGRLLPELERDEELLTIVPAAPVEALIAWRGRPEPGTPTY